MVEEEKAPNIVDISSIDIYPLLGLFINMLSAQAWQYMGLRISPTTKKIEKDFSKAIIAIDCVAFLIDKLESQLSEGERNRLRGLLTDLQINFVRQQKVSSKTKTESQ